MKGQPTLQRFRPAPILWAAFAAWIILGSLAVWARQYRGLSGGLYDLLFDFGPLIQSLAERGAYAVGARDAGDGFRLTAHRMPFPPLALAALARLGAGPLAALLMKNFALFGWAALAWRASWRGAEASERANLLRASAFLFLFPQLAMHGLELSPEEGWTIPLLAIVCAPLLAPRAPEGRAVWGGAALANALLYLSKSALLPFALAACVVAPMRSRRAWVGAIFIVALATAALGWGARNHFVSGRFALGTSYDGYNLSKGNHEKSLLHYPRGTLDAISADATDGKTFATEWVMEDYCRHRALTFMRSHPGDEARLLAARAYNLFFAVWNPKERGDPLERALAALGAGFMIVFRLGLLASLALAIDRAARWRSAASDGAWRGASLLVLVAAYSLPCLAAFAYERHAVALAIPAALYLAGIIATPSASARGRRRA